MKLYSIFSRVMEVRSHLKNEERQTSRRNTFVIAVLILFSINSYSQNNAIEACHTYLNENGQSPGKYVASKFEQYDYVFLGEYHRNKQDVDFVTSLIPDLYKNGVRNIAYEFYAYTSQRIVDSLLIAKEWNEKFLYEELSNFSNITWGYTEYLNIFKKVWEFNQSLNPDQPKFRIVLLGYLYNPCKSGLEMFGGHDPDAFHADILEKEVISKQEKSLIYCGMHHAFTKYRQPIIRRRKFYGLNDGRMGNIINRKYPEKTFTIFLHSPWDSNKGSYRQVVKPVNGAIDYLMGLFNNNPMGFDVKNTVIGTLTANNTYYAIGYDNFKLEDFCDGYVFLLPYKEVKFVSVESNFYDENSLNKLREYMKCRGYSDKQAQKITHEIAISMLTEKPERHYGRLMK